MRVVAYSIKAYEKESLARANQKKHDITLISNPLCPETLHFAAGKDAVLIGPDDRYDAHIQHQLAQSGIRHVLIRCSKTASFHPPAAFDEIQTVYLCNENSQEMEYEQLIWQTARETIEKLDAWHMQQQQK